MLESPYLSLSVRSSGYTLEISLLSLKTASEIAAVPLTKCRCITGCNIHSAIFGVCFVRIGILYFMLFCELHFAFRWLVFVEGGVCNRKFQRVKRMI